MILQFEFLSDDSKLNCNAVPYAGILSWQEIDTCMMDAFTER